MFSAVRCFREREREKIAINKRVMGRDGRQIFHSINFSHYVVDTM